VGSVDPGDSCGRCARSTTGRSLMVFTHGTRLSSSSVAGQDPTNAAPDRSSLAPVRHALTHGLSARLAGDRRASGVMGHGWVMDHDSEALSG
jgi:hypothetical protein